LHFPPSPYLSLHLFSPPLVTFIFHFISPPPSYKVEHSIPWGGKVYRSRHFIFINRELIFTDF
jgi:hypothetical protein